MELQSAHETVLRDRAVEALEVREGGSYVDATFGRGGHSLAILEKLGTKGQLLVIDRDPVAIKEAQDLADRDERVSVRHSEFSQLLAAIREWNNEGVVDGILFDLGVSSPQLDNAERGFSFMRSGPLDMRMNPSLGTTAAEWINHAPLQEIAEVLRKFGEEKHSRRIASAIVEARNESDISTTGQLAEIVKQANPSWERDKHPATRAFQAIRIFINNELEEINLALAQSLEALKPGGRLVVISFHSLEDRIVKRFFRDQARGDDLPSHFPVTVDQLNPRLKVIGKAIKANQQEVAANPRARSAVLRIAEKLA